MTRSKLSPGTKVRFVGPTVKNDGSNEFYWNRMTQAGVVKEQIGDIVIFGNECEVHRRQVTHIIRPRVAEPKREMAEDFKKALRQIASGGGPVDATKYRTWERTDMMNWARKALNRWGGGWGDT